MAIELQGLVGPQTLADGSKATVRLANSGEQLTSLLRGRYFEIVKRGNVYHAATAATGVAPGTAISTTAAFSLYNPKNSGVYLAPLFGAMGYISGTLGAGSVVLAANTDPDAAAVTGTAITTVNGLIGPVTGRGKAFTTATLPANPTIVLPFCGLGASLASTAVQPWQIFQDFGGMFLVPPGCALSYEGIAAAGSSPLVMFGMAWEEVPI